MKAKRLQIGSHKWKVQYLPTVVDPDDGSALTGLSIKDERTIQVDSTQNKEDQGLTLFHEVLHAALFETGLDELISAELEEALVRGISNTLYPLVRSGKLK